MMQVYYKYYLIIVSCSLKELHHFRIYLLLIISGPSTVLPRCALPKYLTEELQKHVPNAIFSSNPCRLIFLISDHLVHDKIGLIFCGELPLSPVLMVFKIMFCYLKSQLLTEDEGVIF